MHHPEHQFASPPAPGDVYPGKKELATLPFEPDRYNAFLGTSISREEMIRILEQLDCRVEGDVITIPSFRADLGCMNDIAEEIMRIYGYDKIASTNIRAETTEGGRSPKQAFHVALENALYGMGLDAMLSPILRRGSDVLCLPT